MAKDPAVLFYTNDFLSGTFTMTNEQVGKYIRLLCLQHQKGKLSEKDMLNICKTYDEEVFSKFIEKNGFFHNKRMYDETVRRKKYSESRRKNRQKKDMSNISKTYVQHMETETENETVNRNKDKKHKYGQFKNVLLTDNELQKLKDKFNSEADKHIENMSEAIEMKGYKYKSHYLAILKWDRENKKKTEKQTYKNFDE